MKQFFSLILTCFVFICSGQHFGGHPPSTKWKQVNTDTVRVIYPEGLDSVAQRVASLVHFYAAKNPTLGEKLKKVDIVLQNQTTLANGYVGLGPFRSEFFLTPSTNQFDLGSIPWPDELAMHEYRHVQQFNNFRRGLSNLMYVLFGEEGYALAINASIPDWFYEGDAVYTESVLSQQGRGRIPYFINQYKALDAAGKNYSWMKLRNGSLKDLIPSHYNLGYLMVNHGYEKYGKDFWKKVTHDAAAFKSLFYPFQAAIRRHAGVDYETFRKEALQQANSDARIPEAIIPVNKNYVQNYSFPYQVDNESLLFLRSTYRHNPAFFIKKNGQMKKLRTRDITFDDQFSYRNGKIVYAAYKADARWGWKDYSDLRLLDVNSGRQQTITRRSKYFTPDISPDGSRIAAVSIQSSGKSEIHILNVSDGSIVQQLRSSEITLFTDPKFIDDNRLVTVVRLNDGRTALAWADINTGAIERLTPPTYNVIGYPQVENNRVYFTAAYFGNDDIFALDLNGKKLYKLTEGGFGKYYVNAGNGRIYYSTYTADGLQISQQPIQDITLNEVNMMSLQEMGKLAIAGDEAYANLKLNGVPQHQYPETKYSKATGLFNFHSWRPYYEDPIFTYSLYGQNVLNTFLSELYYLYNTDEQTSAVGINLNYGGLFPVISAGTEFTFQRRGIANNIVRQWNQLDTRVGLNIPLNFSGGKAFRFLNFGSSYVLRNEFNTGPNKNLFREFNFSYLSHFITFSNLIQQARQHIYPRGGLSLSAQHRHAITELEGYQFYGAGNIYLPGFISNHNIIVSGAFQQRDTSLALFSTRIGNARGYADYYRTTAGSRLLRFSANYHLPLLHPDWGFGNILYFQRFRANLFYDMQRLYSNDKLNDADLRSTGVEFYVDTKWWNQYPLTFGLRVNHLLDDDPLAGRGKGSTWIEFVLPVSILPR